LDHFVVRLIEADDEDHPYKVFSTQGAATAFAVSSVNSRQASRADIIRVTTDKGAKGALLAAQTGEGEIIDSRVRHVSAKEGGAAATRKLDEALRRGETLSEFLRLSRGRRT
jgi:hypothetical protein